MIHLSLKIILRVFLFFFILRFGSAGIKGVRHLAPRIHVRNDPIDQFYFIRCGRRAQGIPTAENCYRCVPDVYSPSVGRITGWFYQKPETSNRNILHDVPVNLAKVCEQRDKLRNYVKSARMKLVNMHINMQQW